MQTPKCNVNKVKLTKETYGRARQAENQADSFDNNVIFPKKLEYEDIDEAVFDFVKNDLRMTTDNGEEMPSFTLFSNQRFSEYSQTWKHTDNEGNLLMDFKTMNRENNPAQGENQGKKFNIPGNRKYTICIREALDDNGTEVYDVYSMKQPIAVDLVYTVGLITLKYENLNRFNTLVQDKFKSLQHYIKPNGYYMPLTLDSIDDDTEYSVENRKFFVQSLKIKCKGYIIPQDSFEIDRKPKRMSNTVGFGEEQYPIKPNVNITDNDDETVSIDIMFHSKTDKVEFEIDENLEINSVNTKNVRSYKLYINERLINLNDKDESFVLNGNEIKLTITKIERNLPSEVKIMCQPMKSE